MTNAYDDAVEHFSHISDADFRDEVFKAWNDPYNTFGGCLFAYTADDDWSAGCLTLIKSFRQDGCDYWGSFGPRNLPGGEELLAEIIADDRIPKHPHDITRESLPAFAEYQQKVDALWKRAPLQWVAPGKYVRADVLNV